MYSLLEIFFSPGFSIQDTPNHKMALLKRVLSFYLLLNAGAPSGEYLYCLFSLGTRMPRQPHPCPWLTVSLTPSSHQFMSPAKTFLWAPAPNCLMDISVEAHRHPKFNKHIWDWTPLFSQSLFVSLHIFNFLVTYIQLSSPLNQESGSFPQVLLSFYIILSWELGFFHKVSALTQAFIVCQPA